MTQKTFKCKNCGKRERVDRWLDGTRLLANKLCFNCDFWINDVGTSDYIVVDGKAYSLCSPNPGGFQGFGGRQHYIQMLDTGEIRTCSNMWSRGEVPENMKHLFQNNAIFINK